MKRNWKLLTVFSVVFMLSLALTGIASADVIRGKGWLYAEGSGAATLRMSGDVEIISHGSGVVYIYGADTIEAEGNGRRKNLRNGGVIFRGYEGKITISGERMAVRMIGKQIEFTAMGKGTAILRGRGHYETEGHSGNWEPDGLTLEVAEE